MTARFTSLNSVYNGFNNPPTAEEIKVAEQKTSTTETSNTLVSPVSNLPPNSDLEPVINKVKTAAELSADTKTNVLDFYRTYTYNFTLASVGENSIIDVQQYIESDFFIIAKSGGKGEVGSEFSLTKRVQDSQSVIDDFNANSSGKYDFYINNVRLDSLMSPSKNTGFTIGTKLEFDIFEPYSIGGFFDALQVASATAGYANYVECPFIFKIDFIGYRDSETPELVSPEIVPGATRYIAINLISADCELTELGCVYRCKAVPVSERALKNDSVLKSAMKLHGTTVGELLADFEAQLNAQLAAASIAETGNVNPANRDVYEIEYVEIDRDSNTLHVVSKEDSEIAKCRLIETPANTSVTNQASGESSISSATTTPGTAAIQFSESTQIHDAIASILRDSEYGNKLTATNDEWRPSFLVLPSTVPVSNGSDGYNKTAGRPYRKYRFSVVQYAVHSSLVNVSDETTKTAEDAENMANRVYNYLYTGKNTSVLSFNLKFNMLFYQAIVTNGGNTDAPAAKKGVSIPDEDEVKTLVPGPPEASPTTIPSKPSPAVSQVVVGNMPNTSNPDVNNSKNYDRLLNSSVDRYTGEIKIVGDPYYLSTDLTDKLFQLRSGQISVANPGEMSAYMRQLCISIRFSTLNDVVAMQPPKFGKHRFNGVYRVIRVVHEFTDGVFSQLLKIVKIASEAPVTKVATSCDITEPDPVNVPTAPPAEEEIISEAASDTAIAEVTPGVAIALPPGISSSVSGTVNGASSAIANVQSAVAAVKSAPGSIVGAINSAVNSASSKIASLFKKPTTVTSVDTTTASNSQA